jgi:hypothetical protein
MRRSCRRRSCCALLTVILSTALLLAASTGVANARPVNWTFSGFVEVQDPSGNPLSQVPVRLEGSTRYNIEWQWDPEIGGGWFYDTYSCTADGATDASSQALLRCEIPWDYAEQYDYLNVWIADRRYRVLERREIVRSQHDLHVVFIAAVDGMELPLVQKFAPQLILTAADQGVRPSPVEIMDRNGDGRLGWEDVLVEVYNLAGDSLGEYRPDEILFFGGNYWYPGQYQYPYFYYFEKYYIIPGWHLEGNTVVPHNPPAIYILIPHFEWGHIGETNASDWYGTYQQALADHSADSRYIRGTTYAHVFTAGGGDVVIQYWFFYPFNFSGNRHEGDWEHVNVVVDSGNVADARIRRVEYYYHEKVMVAYTAGTDYQLADGTHPIVYAGGFTTDQPCSTLAGSGTHGSYPRPGRIDNINSVGSHEMVGGDGLQIDFDNYRNIVLLPKDLPRTVYADNPELTYTVGWQHFAAGWGHPLSKPLPCDHAPFLETIFDIIDRIPFIGRPFNEVAKLVVLGIFKVGQDIYLEDTNKAPPGPRYNTRWETTQR